MKADVELKLQAYLDGELPPGEVREVETILAREQAAADLLRELRQTTAALRGNELPTKAPETREFYWSQIQRRINAESLREERVSRQSPFLGWRKVLASFAGVAAVITWVSVTGHRLPVAPTALTDEVESVGDQETITFRDRGANMTVVWMQGRPSSFTPTRDDDTVPFE